MVAIAEYKVSGATIQGVRFSSDIVHLTDVDKGNAVRELAMQFSERSTSVDNTKKQFAMLNNGPEGEVVKNIDDESGVNCGTLDRVLDACPAHIRKLSDEDKAAKCKVRPAAHRAGQASFFGNI